MYTRLTRECFCSIEHSAHFETCSASLTLSDSQPYPELVAGTLRGPSRCACTKFVSLASSRLQQAKAYPPHSAAFSSAASVLVPAAATAGNRTEANNILPHSGLGHDQTIQHAQVTTICRYDTGSTVSSSQICVARLSAHLH